jgi:hypothetical protein
MMIHTLIQFLILVDEITEQSIELVYHLGVVQTLCKFVPDGDHNTDPTTRLPQPPWRDPGLALPLLLQVDLLSHAYKVSRWESFENRKKGGRTGQTLTKVMTILPVSLLFYSIFVILTL